MSAQDQNEITPTEKETFSKIDFTKMDQILHFIKDEQKKKKDEKSSSMYTSSDEDSDFSSNQEENSN